jgi:hypothetical protein
MPKVLRTPNGRGIYLIPRSGSHSFAAAALQSFHPSAEINSNEHPAASYPAAESGGLVCVIVRNPIERFRSMVAHAQSTVDQQLASPKYGCEFCHGYNFDMYFRFEDQLQECANWLGITVPLPHLDGTDDAEKPILTAEQEARIREIYAADIALWESLQP